MFPQLVAGPIIRYHEVTQQLSERSHTLEKFARGVVFFALGMAKKVLLANPCGMVADTAFEAAKVAEFATLVIEQDAEVCELNQRGLRSHRHDKGVLMPEEYILKRFHDWVRAELGS